MHQVAVLASGGLDSAILIHGFLKKNWLVQPVYIANGHVWESVEMRHLKRFLQAIRSKRLRPLRILALPTRDLYKGLWAITGKRTPGAKSHAQAVYLPGRNILLLAKAGVFCTQHRIPRIAMGSLKTNPFPDANLKFLKIYEQAFSMGLNFELKILTPFLKSTKNQVMRRGAALPLHLTFSCIKPRSSRHCGRCNKCQERKLAFREAGIKDLTPYVR